MNWCGGKDEIITPYGPLVDTEEAEYYVTAKMLNQKFQDFVNDGTPAQYREARHMFADPLNYYYSISGPGKGADDSEEEQELDAKKKRKGDKGLDFGEEPAEGPKEQPADDKRSEEEKDEPQPEGGSPGGLRKGRKKKVAKRQGRRAPQGQDNEGGEGEDFVDLSDDPEPKKEDSDGGEMMSDSGDSDASSKLADEEKSVDFYGPIYPEYSDDPDDGRPDQDEGKRGKFGPGYILVERTHASEEKQKFVFEKGGENRDQFANKVRYYLLTYKEEKKGRTVLHYAAQNGDRHFCTMIIHEANEMGILQHIIDEADDDKLTPLYLLCEKGYIREDHDDSDEGGEADEVDASFGSPGFSSPGIGDAYNTFGSQDDWNNAARRLPRSHEDYGLEYARDDEKDRKMPLLIDSECKVQSRAYLVKLLITHGANPNMQSPRVWHTPLHWLCYWGDWRAVNQLLKLNTIDKIKLEGNSLKKAICLEGTPTTEQFLAKRGAFNSFQTHDGQTPVDIAGDLEHYKCVKYIIKHFLKDAQQQTIMDAFITDEKKREHGLNAFPQQQTKQIKSTNGFKKVESQTIKIIWPSSKNMTNIQKSYIHIAYWACYCMQSDQSEEFDKDQPEVKNFVYLFIMDCGVSPFVKAYEGRTLISATVPSCSVQFLTELLSHKYLVRFEEDFEQLIKRCKSKDVRGNNLLHEVCKLQEAHRNKYFEVINKNHVEIVYRPFQPVEYIPPEERSGLSCWCLKDRIKATGLMDSWKTTTGAGCSAKCVCAFIKVLFIIIVFCVPFLLLLALGFIPVLLVLLCKWRPRGGKCCPKRERKKVKSHHCIPGDYATSEPKANAPMYNDKPSLGMKAKIASFTNAKTMKQVQAVKDQARERVRALAQSFAEEKAAELKEKAKAGLSELAAGMLPADSEAEETAGAENEDEDDQAEAEEDADPEDEQSEADDSGQEEGAEEDAENEGEGIFFQFAKGKLPHLAKALRRAIIKDDRDPDLTKEVTVWVQCGDFKKRNRQALLPHQLVHKQPLAITKEFLTAAKRHKGSARVLFDDLKELYRENFEADFVIVIKEEKYAFITEQLQEDLDIHPYNQDIDKTCPQLKRSIFFEFTKGEENKLKRTTKDIYLAAKFSATMIDDTAHAHKMYGDLIENSIRFKFHKLMHDHYVAFDARQHFECVMKKIENQMDLNYLRQSGSIEDFFPLHRTKAYEEVTASIDKYERMIVLNTFFGDDTKHLEPIHFLRRYQGEKYAFFYLFFYHYIAYLTIPAFVSVLFMGIQVYFMVTSEDPNVNINDTILDSVFNGYFGVITAIWTTFLVESWRKREQTLAFEWDLDILKDKYEGTERQDFLFMSMYDSNTNVRTKESIRNREVAKAGNFIFRLFMFAVVALTIVFIEGDEDDEGPLTAESVATQALNDLYQPQGLLISAIIALYEAIYCHYSAQFIADMNFKYQHDFDDTTTIQLFVFNFFNTFFPFCFVAFNPQKRGHNFNTLFSMLISTIAIDQFLKQNLFRFLAYFVGPKGRMDEEKRSIEEKEFDLDVANIKDKVESQVQFNYVMEANKSEIVTEYMDLAMQYAMVALFSNVLPVASFFCLLVNLLKLQAIKLEFRYTRRIIPELSFGIGQFLGIFEFVSYLAVLFNIGISYLASTRLRDIFLDEERFGWDEIKILLFFVFLEHFMCLFKAFVAIQYQAWGSVARSQQEAARAIFRKNHEYNQDKRLNAFKHVANKFSALFFRDKKDRDDAKKKQEEKEEQEKLAAKQKFLKKHTRLKPIHRTIAEYKEGRQAEIQIFPDRDNEQFNTPGYNNYLINTLGENIKEYAKKVV